MLRSLDDQKITKPMLCGSGVYSTGRTTLFEQTSGWCELIDSLNR